MGIAIVLQSRRQSKQLQSDGSESANLDYFAQVFSEALGRTIGYRSVSLPDWNESLRQLGLPTHFLGHLDAMAKLHVQGRYDRLTEDMVRLTGKGPTSMYDFVKLLAADFSH